MKQLKSDIGIIGAGPAGTVAACLLRQLGYSVTLLEKLQFPRFVIGESLLAKSLQTLENAGCLSAVAACGYQRKAGARFKENDHYADIIFNQKFSDGPGYAYHVKRADFDLLLADCAVEKGADIHYQHTVTAITAACNHSRIDFVDNVGKVGQLDCRFILDASGYGRVLPRLLGIDKPSSLPPRASLFSHITDHIPENSPHSRDRTLITIHPTQKDVWYWLISFADGTSSIGAVGNADYLAPFQAQGLDGLKAIIAEDKALAEITKHSQFADWYKTINAYSGSVSDFYGDGFAVLGNAGEFLDPVFSSGVTAALQSSELAVAAVDKTLRGENIDWQSEYVDKLMIGIEIFRRYVEAWYDGRLQKVIFAKDKNPQVTEMIASILAGYAWDTNNPFVREGKRLDALAALCSE